MTQHVGLPVHGYRPQSSAALEAVNVNKQLEESTLRRIDELGGLAGVDQRWLAIGRTNLELAWMAVNRAIFQPGRARLPGDDLPEAAELAAPAATGGTVESTPPAVIPIEDEPPGQELGTTIACASKVRCLTPAGCRRTGECLHGQAMLRAAAREAERLRNCDGA